MIADSDDTRLDSTVILMDDLLDQIGKGRLRVPMFQRPFEWRPDQMIDLFDSIERGYPIGSLLLWQTDYNIPTLPQIGGMPVPSGGDGRMVSYVLDGHQRLSTLFGVLRYQPDGSSGGSENSWRWRIYRDLRASRRDLRYRHHRGQSAPPAHFLPLRAVSRTMDFLEFSREIELRERDRERLKEMVGAAETVAHKIKNYQIAMVRLIGGDLDQAVEVYTRLNRKGSRMDADQMVSALTYRAPGRPTLANRIDAIIESIAETGFGLIPRPAVFRALLAIADEPDVMSPHWEAVAGRLENKLFDAVPDTEEAIVRAVTFLRRQIRVPLAKFLPYAHQLMLLAVFFHHRPVPSDAQSRDLSRWFWVTSWSSAFAGANSTTLRHALQEMKDFAQDKGKLHLDAGQVQPIPDTFNLNSARTRAYVTWELIELPDRLDQGGFPINVVELLASADSQVFRSVEPNDPRPANRIILPSPSGVSARKALLGIYCSDERRVLDSHGIPRQAADRLREGDGRGFVMARAEHLEKRLHRFAAKVGVPLASELVGESDDDVDTD